MTTVFLSLLILVALLGLAPRRVAAAGLQGSTILGKRAWDYTFVEPRFAVENTPAPRRSLLPQSTNQRGLFAQVGGSGGLSLGISPDYYLDLGPQEQGAIGYIWGPVGVRGSFVFVDQDRHDSLVWNRDSSGGTVDVMFFPFTKYNFNFRPYFFYGAGERYYESSDRRY